MDMQRKKQLLFEYKNRRPEMGIVSFFCVPTGESFLGYAKDTAAEINGNCFRLAAGRHPNRSLQELWNRYGHENFTVDVAETLSYDDKRADQNYTADLEKLLVKLMDQNQNAKSLKP